MITTKIINWIERDINLSDKEIIVYGINQICIISINVLTFFLISVALHSILLGISFLAGFIPLRMLAGGYHASTKFRCYVVSNLIFSASLIQLKNLNIQFQILITISIGIGGLIFAFAPVDNSERRLNMVEKQMIKKKLKRILPLYIGLIFLGEVMSLKFVEYSLFCALLFVLFLQLIGILKDRLHSCYIS